MSTAAAPLLQSSSPAAAAEDREGALLAVVAAALGAAEQVASSGGDGRDLPVEPVIAALLAGVRALGFARVLVETRDARAERSGAWLAAPGDGPLPPPLGAGVWRRWLRLFGRRREIPGAATGRTEPVDGARWFDLTADAWARAEFGTLFGVPSPNADLSNAASRGAGGEAALDDGTAGDGTADDGTAGDGALGNAAAVAPADGTAARGVLFVLVPDEGDGVRTVLAAERDAPGAPSADTVRAAVLLTRAAAGRLGRARLTALAAAQAERLHRLHEAGVALARSLDEGEVVRELARQVARLVPHDGLVVAHPDVERGTVRTALRLVRGLARPRSELPLGGGPLAEAARSGAPVRLGEYDAAREPLAAADDVVGDAGPARSVLAVPMRVGTRLVGVLAVHAAAPAAFGADDAELLRTVAAQAAVALANARAFAESEGERRQSDALVALARAVGGSRRPGEVLRLGLRHTLALLGAEGAFVALRQGAHLHVVAGAGSAELFAGALLAVDGTVPGRAAGGGAAPNGTASNESMPNGLLPNGLPPNGETPGGGMPAVGAPRGAVIDNRVGDAGHAAFPLHDVAPVRKTVVVPLVTAEGVIGVLGAVNRAEDFGPADARVLGRLGELLAVAAVNARLFASVEEATREWRVAFDATGAGMAVLDSDGRVTRANVRAAELLGATAGGVPSPPALLGADFVARVCGTDDAGTAAEAVALRALLHAGERRRARVRALGAPRPDAELPGADSTRTGRVFEVLASPHPAGGTVATFDDVTAQVALAERHRLVVETSRDALLITSRAGRVVYANPAAVALFGRGPALVGVRSLDLMRPGDAAALARGIARRRLHEPLEYEFTTVRPDGTERVVAASTAPLRELGDAGPASGVVAALRDVTEERRAQDAARASSERYAQLVEAAADGIVTVDAAGVVTSANRAMARAAGGGRGGLAGRHCLELVDPRDRGRAEALLAAALGGARARGELRFRDRRGRPRVASVTAAPVAAAAPGGALGHAIGNAVGTGPGVLAVVRDVTEERRTADQLVQREKLAAMGQLVGGVAHELNNPLAGVLAVSELLLAEPLLADPAEDTVVDAATRHELRELTATVHREARRAARTVSRLLDFARQHAPRRAPADVNQALVDALDLRRSSLRLAGVDLALDLDYELPTAWADAHQLQQVFLNLITNAEYALAGHAGPRRLVLRTRAVTRDGSAWVVAEVRDSGPGLTAGDEERVFEPFYTTKPEGAGTGLGLAVSAGIVREHGGVLRAEHAPGAGAAFVVELPAARGDTAGEEVAAGGRAG